MHGGHSYKFPTTCFSVGSQCSAITHSPNGKSILVAGREVLCLLTYANGQFVHSCRMLRTKRRNLTYGANCVHWHPSLENRLVCGTTNGSIVVWSLNNGNFKQEFCKLNHERVVNAVQWRPGSMHEVLSASRTCKLWDTRDSKMDVYTTARMTCVRDASFSPNCPDLFTTAHDSGNVMVWDLRNTKGPLTLFPAHGSMTGSVDWHRTRDNILATGSIHGSEIKIWDLAQTNERNLEPIHVIHSNTETKRLRWRPGCFSQLAATASTPAFSADLRVHLWDYRSPYVPILSFKGHLNIVSDFIFLPDDERTIISCSLDKTVRIHSNKHGENARSELPSSAICFSPIDSLAFVKSRTNSTVDLDSGLANGPQFNPVVSISPPLQQTVPSIGNAVKFSFLAHYYKTDPYNFVESTKYNCKVAKAAGLFEIAELWRLIETLFADIPIENSQPKEAIQKAVLSPQSSEEKSPASSTTSEPQMFGNSIFSILDNTIANEETDDNVVGGGKLEHWEDLENALPNPAIPDESCYQVLDNECANSFIQEVLDSLLETADVQTASVLCMVLGNRIQISEGQRLRVFSSYIELLQRHTLCAQAAIALQHAPAQVQEYNMKGTQFTMGCGHCDKGRVTGSLCNAGCRPMECAYCQLPCYKMVIASRDCGHGGHIECMAEWYRENTLCPTGCGKSIGKNPFQ